MMFNAMSPLGAEDKALLAALIVQQEAFYSEQSDYFKAFFEKMGKPMVAHVTVGDQGIYLGQMKVAGRLFALLENRDWGFYILPAAHCESAEQGQRLEVVLDKSAAGPRLMAVKGGGQVNKPLLQASTAKRTRKALLAELMAEQHAFFDRYREELVGVFRQTGKKITCPVTVGDRGQYAGEVEIGARVFALLEHQPGQCYILPAQNCYHTRDKQGMRVLFYQSECSEFYWFIAVVDKPTAEDGLLADFNVGQSQSVVRDSLESTLSHDGDKGVEYGMKQAVSFSRQEVSKKNLDMEKAQDFEMEM